MDGGGIVGDGSGAAQRLRSRAWFDNPDNPDMTALYLERYMNFGLTREELQSGKPIIGIAQTGSDLSPCNRHHLVLAERVREGIREAGGIAIEFPVHPIQETGKRPTAGARPQPRLSRPGRDALRLSARRRGADHRLRQDHARAADGGGDRQHPGDRALRRADAERLVQGRAHRLGHDRLEGARAAGAAARSTSRASSSWSPRRRRRPAICNTMGTATTMNSLAEALGMYAARLARRSRRPTATARQMRLSHRAADRRDGARGPQALRHHDARGLRSTRSSSTRRSAARPTRRSTSTPSPRHLGVELDNDDWETDRPRRSRCSSTCSRPASTWARTTTAPAACRPSSAS